jgi:hypothetical protein
MSGMAAFSLKNGVAIALTISNAGTVAGIFLTAADVRVRDGEVNDG